MEQAEKLMNAFRKRRNRGASLVELRAAFALAVGAGCERAVLEKLRVRDIELQFDPKTDEYLDGTVNAEGTKNEYRDRESRVMWGWCARAVREAMKDKLPDALLVGSAVRDRHTLNDTIKRAAEDLGLPYYSLHGQRHTHATLMLKQGGRHNVVAHQLGHGNAWQVITRYGKYKVSKDDYRNLGGRATPPTTPRDTPQAPEPKLRLAK